MGSRVQSSALGKWVNGEQGAELSIGEMGEWAAGCRTFLFIQHFMVPYPGLSSCHLSSHSITARTVAWARANQPYLFGETKVQGERSEGRRASSWQAQRSPSDPTRGLGAGGPEALALSVSI